MRNITLFWLRPDMNVSLTLVWLDSSLFDRAEMYRERIWETYMFSQHLVFVDVHWFWLMMVLGLSVGSYLICWSLFFQTLRQEGLVQSTAHSCPATRQQGQRQRVHQELRWVTTHAGRLGLAQLQPGLSCQGDPKHWRAGEWLANLQLGEAAVNSGLL